MGDSGEVACWGFFASEPEYIPEGPFRSVSAGLIHACAVRNSGELECWGLVGGWEWCPVCDFPIEEDYGQAEPPPGTYGAVSAAGTHTCAIRESGAVACWGGRYRELTDAPTGRYRSLSAARGYTCAARESGEIDCWGRVDAQSSAPSGTYRVVSASGGTPLGIGFSVVESGRHACGLRESGQIDCWLGRADQTDVPPGTYRAVSAGFGYTCAIRESGEIVCWGLETVPREIQ